MAKTVYLTYYVNLPDRALVDSLLAQYPDGVIRAPYNPVGPGGMAVEAAILLREADPGGGWPALFPIIQVGDVPLGQAFTVPSLHSMYFDPHSNSFPRDVATFTISSGWWIFGKSTKFYWVATFQYMPAPEGAGITDSNGDVTRAAPIPARFFIDGMEILEHGEGSVALTTGRALTRAGAIDGDGMGYAYRNNAPSALTRAHQFPASPARNAAWSRFYVRRRNAPNVTTEIFRVTSASSSTGGARLAVTADGHLAMYIAEGSVISLVSVTSGQLLLGERQRIDVLTTIMSDNVPVTPNPICRCTYFLDGILIGRSTHNPGGLAANARITDLQLGQSQNLASTLEIDFDDWHCSDIPIDKNPPTPLVWDGATLAYHVGDYALYTGTRPTGVPMPQIGVELFRSTAEHLIGDTNPPRKAVAPFTTNPGWELVTESADWILGSRIVLLNNTAFASSVNWTGDYRQVSNPFTRQAATGGITSGTSAAVVAMTTDALIRLGNVPGAVGWAAVNVGVESNKTAAAADGSVGYKIGAAAAAYTAIVGELTTGGWSNALYAPAALQEPEPFVAVEAHYKKGADANTSRVRCLMASVEVCGCFADCDIPPVYDATLVAWVKGTGQTVSPSRGSHNAPYPDTPWFRNDTAPLGPIVIKSGTYVGNDTGQNLLFPVPPHFITIRPLAGDTGGARYFSAAPNLQKATTISGASELGPGYARRDPSFVPASQTADQQMQFMLTIGGTDSQINANGVTYQYVAYMDPGARFNLCGASYHEQATGLLPVSEALEGSTFLAEWGWFWRFDLSVSSTDELWTKGAGHTAAQASKCQSGAAVASAVTFGNGSLTWDSGFVDATSRWGTVFSLWRKADGNNDPDQAKVWCHGTYVGDGNASRTVPISPASGLRPLYAYVQPVTAAAALHRDPSHTGTTSSQVSNGSANASTGITAGAIDGFTVGSALNGNGITYNWFVILGSATAGNGGWSVNGTFTPIASDTPVDPNYATPPSVDLLFPPGEPAVPPTTAPADEPDLDDTAPLPGTDLFCVDFTTKLINQALSRIGVNKRIKDLIADTTIEANTARLHIKQDVEATLRRYPWPFATRYADLVVVGGTADDAVNQDWQYSYRAPTDMVYARRLVNQAGMKRGPDPDPPSFRFSTDDDGGLVYADADVEEENLSLEYTQRNRCPAFFGDAIFRDALIWRIGASLAPSLSKDSKKADYCLAQFERVLSSAETVAANEARPEDDISGDAPWIRDRG